MQIRTVGVVGCGLMGSGIVQVVAQHGVRTLVREVSAQLLERGLERIRGSLRKGVEKGKLTQADGDRAWSQIHGTVGLEEFRDCDLVVEAVLEKLEEKKEVFRALDRICPPHAILASNTSCLPIGEMASVTKRPEKVLGLHFMNPVPVMKLVEIVRGLRTSQETYETARKFVEGLGKETITARDNPGFIINTLLIPFMLDAVRAVEDGVGTPEEIDKGMKLGCGQPMGPIELLDFVGLDTTLYIADAMFDEYKSSRYAAPPLLRRMVTAGRLGRKSGQGFYAYSGKASLLA